MHIFSHKLLSALLLPLSILYGLVVRVRNWLYDSDVLTSERSAGHVISIGNLSVGGTGKTPAIIYFAQRLMEEGRRVAVISRGYRRRSRGLLVVSDGTRVLASPHEAGDEPSLLARRLNGAAIVVDKNRRRAVRFARERFHAEVFLLDDGFQHRKLARDEEHVLVSATYGFGNGRLLPAGPLREPISSLARATQVWVTKVSDPSAASALTKRIREVTDSPIRYATYRPVGYVEWPRGPQMPLATLHSKKTFCFAGIAEPRQFFESVAAMDAEVVGTLALPDHVTYSRKLRELIEGRAQKVGAEVLVTTEKDMVKLATQPFTISLYCLIVQFEPEPAAAMWNGAVSSRSVPR
jgi:tetraacyldisaccharide 4'-kinase